MLSGGVGWKASGEIGGIYGRIRYAVFSSGLYIL